MRKFVRHALIAVSSVAALLAVMGLGVAEETDPSQLGAVPLESMSIPPEPLESMSIPLEPLENYSIPLEPLENPEVQPEPSTM